jgi:hypothetical protein
MHTWAAVAIVLVITSTLHAEQRAPAERSPLQRLTAKVRSQGFPRNKGIVLLRGPAVDGRHQAWRSFLVLTRKGLRIGHESFEDVRQYVLTRYRRARLEPTTYEAMQENGFGEAQVEQAIASLLGADLSKQMTFQATFLNGARKKFREFMPYERPEGTVFESLPSSHR